MAYANDNAMMVGVYDWHPGQRVVTRDGVVAVVIGQDSHGHVIGLGPRDAMPRVIRPVTDSWGGEHDCAMMNVA